VADHPGLAAAFPYRRDAGEGPRTALGLVGEPGALTPGSDAVEVVLAAWGDVDDRPPDVVALEPDLGVLAAVLAVADPLGAGGRLEVEVAAAHRDPTDQEVVVRACASLVDGPVVVPQVGAGQGATGRHGPATRLRLPVATHDGATGVGVFTSLYAMVRSVGPRPETTMAGWALVEAVPDDAQLVVDPGTGWAWAPPMPLLRRLARRTPRTGTGAFAPG
jgi:hypothetical protein